MTFGMYLTGPFGPSQNLYHARNEAKRKRGTQETVIEQVREDTKKVIALQRDAGLDFIIDSMFNFFYLFQPFAEKIQGVRVGPQENWFNNNVFYWRPQIQGPLNPQTGFTEQYIHLGELPTDGTAMVILPSPYTLLMLSDVKGYSDRKQAVVNLAEVIHAEAQHLASRGVGRIQYDEPAIVVKQSLGSLTEEDIKLLERAMEVCGQVSGATTSLHTYFGDAGPVIPVLIDLPVDCIGIDCTETRLSSVMNNKFHEKELALGLVDARNTALESKDDLVRRLREVAEKSQPKALWITPNTSTEYRGYTHAVNKLALLEDVRRAVNE